MSRLFTPLHLRGVSLKNRIVASPICQYSAADGIANDHHLVHYGRLALGGFGCVMVEATAVTPEGRITHGDLGIWSDKHTASLARLTRFAKEHGAVPAIQLSHAGRKGSTRRPWRGEGTVVAADQEELGDAPWTTLAPSALAHSSTYAMPQAVDHAGIEYIRAAFADGARRALEAGFEIVELHCAHGYLLNQFLSPLANARTDAYGGNRENRMRLSLKIVKELREIWPEDRPVFVRVSATDHIREGWSIDDTIAFASELHQRDVDVIDCSSGGFEGAAFNALSDYHVPYADRVTRETGMQTMAAGLITDPEQAEAILQDSNVKLVGLARETLVDPNWPLHALGVLGGGTDSATDWPQQAGYALRNRPDRLKR